jgi:hypothetical protein
VGNRGTKNAECAKAQPGGTVTSEEAGTGRGPNRRALWAWLGRRSSSQKLWEPLVLSREVGWLDFTVLKDCPGSWGSGSCLSSSLLRPPRQKV